jgi:hypothetical protein
MIIFDVDFLGFIFFWHSERVLDGKELHSRGWLLKVGSFLLVFNGVRAGCVFFISDDESSMECLRV